MNYQWLNPRQYFGEKVCHEYTEIDTEEIILSMVGMENEVKTLGGRHNRKKREKLELIIKEMSAILNANCL